MGKPENKFGFKHLVDGEINVYIKSELKPKGKPIEITLGKFLWTKHLNVEGLSV